MKPVQKILALVLVVLLAASVYGLLHTEQPPGTPVAGQPSNGAAAAQAPLVDQSHLLMAQRLAKMPTSPEEQPFAQEALRLADHQMDLAFATAERDAEEHPPALSAQAKEIQERLKNAEDALDADNALVARLTADAAKVTGARKDALGDQLVLATAHQEEHQDEVDDAKGDLERAGGDPKSRIEAMMQEHKASSEATDALRANVSTAVDEGGLIHRFQQWLTLHQKQLLLWQAKQAAESAAALLSARHNEIAAQIDSRKNSPAQANGPANTNQPAAKAAAPPQLSHEDSAELVKATKLRAAKQKAMSAFDKRMDDQKQLADNYGKWIRVIAAKQKAEFHRALIGVIVILGILLIGVFFDSWLEKLLGKTALDRRQVETLRTVTRVTIQVLAVVMILLVIFGLPKQIGTVLGLAGAGLTVALKDFIVAFLGWFVLMGKNGIRLGDWVEINGVTGEVVELGMFHTVLLETGNWTDSGHPTGRRVTFTNSFAIEGHYFNFSTSGQWLWDELQVVLPAGRDPYPMVDAIQKIVLEATAETAKQAEKEWQGVTRSRDAAHTLTAAPAINVKPVVGGVEIAVRYITRANERYQLRAKLNQAAVDLLGQSFVAPPAAAAEPDGKPAG
ncbi:MAG TPA: mechanosensitive ion channel domain-containing protein [Candidatus Cybelea sp.]|jgi:small-conductance mechanosensitive channel|nr:mechanosensitive ion channel domain-containing protein [Candidatus Cybelea sp.]